MTAWLSRKTNARLALAGLTVVCAAAAGCGASIYAVPVETPTPAKLDVSPFQRVLVAGFVAGGADDIDTNQETVRLLRSQLRSKAELRVIDADVMQLVEVAQEQNKAAVNDTSTGDGLSVKTSDSTGVTALPQKIKDEKDLEPYDRLFANTAYWKRIGE